MTKLAQACPRQMTIMAMMTTTYIEYSLHKYLWNRRHHSPATTISFCYAKFFAARLRRCRYGITKMQTSVGLWHWFWRLPGSEIWHRPTKTRTCLWRDLRLRLQISKTTISSGPFQYQLNDILCQNWRDEIHLYQNKDQKADMLSLSSTSAVESWYWTTIPPLEW